MRINVSFLALGILGPLLLQSALLLPVQAGQGERHSGTVLAVSNWQTPTLVVEEMVEEAKVRKLQVLITAQTQLVRSERLPKDQVTDPRRPFRDSPIGLSEIRLGDFVVVELTVVGEGAVASSVTLTFRGGAR